MHKYEIHRPFYLQREGKVMPLTPEKLLRAYQKNQLKPEDTIRQSGEREWRAYASIDWESIACLCSKQPEKAAIAPAPATTPTQASPPLLRVLLGRLRNALNAKSNLRLRATDGGKKLHPMPGSQLEVKVLAYGVGSLPLLFA